MNIFKLEREEYFTILSFILIIVLCSTILIKFDKGKDINIGSISIPEEQLKNILELIKENNIEKAQICEIKNSQCELVGIK